LARKKKPPLTAAEIDLAKRINAWFGRRKLYVLESDERGNQFTNKNMVDIVDQYFFEHDSRITLNGEWLDPTEATTILRRYRAAKAAETKRKNKRKALREARRLVREAEKKARDERRRIREAKKAREAELKARQTTFF
jgi:hypothetical protein